MGESYIVAFYAGSSGRFIANLMYASISAHDSHKNYAVELSEFNSAHITTLYGKTFDVSSMTGPRIFSNPEIYKRFNFTAFPGIITVHAAPDFTTIEQRYPKAKLIVISFNEHDIPEIIGNNLLKNGFENLWNNDFSPDARNTGTSFILRRYHVLTGTEYEGQQLSIEISKEIFSSYQKRIESEIRNSFYINPIIPDSFTNKTLVLPYRELCTEPEKTIDQLSRFIRRPCQNSITFYKEYLDGRERIIKTYMPWLPI